MLLLLALALDQLHGTIMLNAGACKKYVYTCKTMFIIVKNLPNWNCNYDPLKTLLNKIKRYKINKPYKTIFNFNQTHDPPQTGLGNLGLVLLRSFKRGSIILVYHFYSMHSIFALPG